jgi:recombination protein RecT
MSEPTQTTAVTRTDEGGATVMTMMERKVRQVMPLVNNDRNRAEKVVRVAANAVAKTPALANCDPAKLWLAVQDIAAMNLPIGGRGAYLVPYKGDCTVIISPHGLIELAFRHPLVKSVQARVVREGEQFSINYAPEATVSHAPNLTGEAGKMIGAYAIIELTTGGRVVEWMTRLEIQKVRQSSQSARSGRGPWVDWEDEMWRKTVLKRAMKYVPQSEEMMRALDMDDEEHDLTQTATVLDRTVVTGKGVSSLKSALGLAAPPVEAEAPVAAETAANEPLAAKADDLNDDGDFDEA